MGLSAWLDMEGKDIAAFMVAGLLGYLAGTIVPAGPWAIYTSILVSYHLFLGWLLVTAEHKTGVSLPIASTIATHLACLALILTFGMARRVPFFGFFRYGIAALAIFERGWLFSGMSNQLKPLDVPSAPPAMVATGDDYQEWLRHLAQQKTTSRKLGTSLKAEYEQWLLTRAQNRTAEPSNDGPQAGDRGDLQRDGRRGSYLPVLSQ